MLEAGMADPDGQRGDLDPAQPCLGEEPGQITVADPGQAGLIAGGRIEPGRVTRIISRRPATGSAMK
jgi:hypothetical protein